MEYPVRVPGAGDAPTVLQQAPKRIVALDLGAVELLSRMGAGEHLVGLPSGAPVPAGVEAQTVVPPSGQIDVQEIVSLRPDLIVATPDTDPVDVARAQRNSGAALYIQPADSVDDVIRSTIELGFLVGEPAKARMLVAEMRRSLADLDAALDGVPDSNGLCRHRLLRHRARTIAPRRPDQARPRAKRRRRATGARTVPARSTRTARP